MERRGQKQFAASVRSQIHYTQAPSTSTLSSLFNGRNCVVPKGRIHSPGETTVWKKNISHKVPEILVPENNSPSGNKHQNGDKDDDFLVLSQTSQSFFLDVLEDIENRSPRNTFKLPVHFRNSNLNEVEQRWDRRDEKVVHGKGTALKMEIEQKTPAFETKDIDSFEDSHFHRKESMSRILTGTVGKVMCWFKLKNYFDVLIEVIAVLVDVKEGLLTGEKCLVLRDDISGPSLFVKYYEMDIKLSSIDIGSVIKCVGKLTSRTHFQAFMVALSSEDERNHSQRLFFMSNLVAEEAKTFFMKN